MIYEETKHRIAAREQDRKEFAEWSMVKSLHPYDEHLELLNRGEKIHCWCLTGRYVIGVEGQ